MSEPSRPLLVQLPFTARTYDIDYAGIVHNTVYVRWLEDLRLAVLERHLPLEELIAEKLSPVLEKTEIHYRSPMRLFDTVNGSMWVSALRKARWVVQAEFTRGNLLIATAEQSGYIVDLKSLRPVRIPERLRATWERDQAHVR